ncbi:MAG: hypothetical protein HETSPECPRED_005585 [Heterodermia speciosa]|uniref:Uncharacterized protein n=1 Tax=Heterodermia speciosa TaxID=116794 RepID=A0A8H3FH48_9LECA|nr:MAG: hypothetical protein HETSPECPRED_005585 [Heterodermia speciosa]
MGHYDGADDHTGPNYVDYTGQYEAQDRAAVAQSVPRATEYTTSTMTSTLTRYTNGSAGQSRNSNALALEHAGRMITEQQMKNMAGVKATVSGSE